MILLIGNAEREERETVAMDEMNHTRALNGGSELFAVF